MVIFFKLFEFFYLFCVLNVSLDLINYDELELELFDVYDVCVFFVDDSKLVCNYI